MNLIIKAIKTIPSLFQIIFFILFFNFSGFAQSHRYERYDGPRDGNLGLNCLFVGGIIWGIGMLIGYGIKKNESGTVQNGQGLHLGIVGILCVGGALIALFGLIMLGF